jgi:phosphonate transport system permease protein
VLPAIFCGASRALIVSMRSIHELLWAVLLLAALGLNSLAAVIAIAIPYGGTLAKVFSELIDEAPRDAAHALRGAGATGIQSYCFALLPAATPDLIAYAFYRFECTLRSSAVMGFFGFPTLGLYIRQSFSSTNYGEVWTYLYTLIFMLILFDAWSAAVRKRVLG